MVQLKESYYKEKFGFTSVDKLSYQCWVIWIVYIVLLVARDVVNELATCYIVAVEWILRYYYTGVPSWSWYVVWSLKSHCFRIFCAKVLSVPLCSLRFWSERFCKHQYQIWTGQTFWTISAVTGSFATSKQATSAASLSGVLLWFPCQQLMYCCYGDCLCYQPLMTDEHSPILDFYPLKFSIDLNGKRQEWEAVVLIPFIDEVCYTYTHMHACMCTHTYILTYSCNWHTYTHIYTHMQDIMQCIHLCTQKHMTNYLHSRCYR